MIEDKVFVEFGAKVPKELIDEIMTFDRKYAVKFLIIDDKKIPVKTFPIEFMITDNNHCHVKIENIVTNDGRIHWSSARHSTCKTIEEFIEVYDIVLLNEILNVRLLTKTGNGLFRIKQYINHKYCLENIETDKISFGVYYCVDNLGEFHDDPKFYKWLFENFTHDDIQHLITKYSDDNNPYDEDEREKIAYQYREHLRSKTVKRAM